MIAYIYEQIKGNKGLRFVSLFFFVLTAWWITIYFRHLTEGFENNLFTVVYCLIALMGGIAGWVFAKKWGGFKSILGTSLQLFSLGLLAQFLGQVLYIVYIYILGIEVPYPSIGDIFYLGSVILYLIGVIYLSRVSGMKLSLGTVKGKFFAITIPLIILLGSYAILLRGYEADWSNKIVVFLDWGYPIGQAAYVSIALMILFISKDILGGLMKKPIVLLLLALILQYTADFNFSYQTSHNSWYVGGVNDFLFAASYFVMTFALFSIGNMFYKVQET